MLICIRADQGILNRLLHTGTDMSAIHDEGTSIPLYSTTVTRYAEFILI